MTHIIYLTISVFMACSSCHVILGNLRTVHVIVSSLTQMKLYSAWMMIRLVTLMEAVRIIVYDLCGCKIIEVSSKQRLFYILQRRVKVDLVLWT